MLSGCKLIVKPSKLHGMGVFAGEDIEPDTMVEKSLLLEMSADLHVFGNYTFDTENGRALVLGNGSIYNHSDHPNVEFELDKTNGVMIFHATRFIKRGEEMFISYGKNWFSERRLTVISSESFWDYRYRYALLFAKTAARFMLVAAVYLSGLYLMRH